MATVTTRIWDVQGERGEFYGTATYDDVTGKISSIVATNNDNVPHSVIVTWKGADTTTVVPAGQTITYNPPAAVKWGTDQFSIRTL